MPAYWRTFAKGSVDRLATRRGFKLLTYLSFGFAALVYMIVLTCGTFTFRDVGLQVDEGEGKSKGGGQGNGGV